VTFFSRNLTVEAGGTSRPPLELLQHHYSYVVISSQDLKG
jgi:hypothetical protein